MKAKLLIVVGIIVSTALAGVWASPGGVAEATKFEPEAAAVAFSTLAVDGNPDITSIFEVNDPSSNFSAQAGDNINFTDSDVLVASASDIANEGAYMGQLTSTAQLGLAGNGCFNGISVTFDFVEASTGGTIITPSGPSDNLLANLAEDDGDLDNDGIVDVSAFANNGIADGADAYPSFVRDSLDPDGTGAAAAIVPRARYFGVAFVASSLIVLLQLVILEPGALTVIPGLEWADASWGYPNLTFLQDPVAPASNSAISDFCNFKSALVLNGTTKDNGCTDTTPLATSPCAQSGGGFTLRLACEAGVGTCPSSTSPDESGTVRATNPSTSQTVTWRQHTTSLRDWDSNGTVPEDGDGIENNQDPCPTHVDSWNQLAAPQDDIDSGNTDTEVDGFGDAAGDGLPNTSTAHASGLSCDPSSTFPSNTDEDGDGWLNRIDNCPLVANGNGFTTLDANVAQGDTLLPVALTASLPNNPVGFSVGDTVGLPGETGLKVLSIDPGVSLTVAAPGVANAGGHSSGDAVRQDQHAPNTGQFSQDIPVGTAVPDGGPRSDFIGNVCETSGGLTPTGVNGHYHSTVVVVHNCIGTTTSDCSTSTDTDSDGIVNNLDNCIGGANAVPATDFAQTQRDLNADGFSDIDDIIEVAGAFGRVGGDPTASAGYEGRLDLNYDRFVDIDDIVLVAGTFGATC